jgi:hypothetical protein
MYAGGILPRLLAFSPREKAAGMPMPEGRMRGISEKLAPLAKDGGGPISFQGARAASCRAAYMPVPEGRVRVICWPRWSDGAR